MGIQLGLPKSMETSSWLKFAITLPQMKKSHGKSYTKIVEKLFEINLDSTVVAFANMMRKKITMSAEFIYDG
ncbi:hypothetical protein DITRI_Ditri07aG0059300 [Diplodiscus trichospermus]